MKSVAGVVPDLVLYNATVHTVDRGDAVAEAVAIGLGRIVAVGSNDDVRRLAGPGTRQIDLAGRTVTPGFVDAHPHMDTVGVRLIKFRFTETGSIAALLDELAREVARRRPGEWILCNPVVDEPDVFEYPAAFAEGRWPNRHDLDAVSPANPVYIEPPSLVAPGMAIANSAALRACGITRATTFPDGVNMLVDASGEPTGVFEDYNFPKRVPVPDGGFDPRTSQFPAMPAFTRDDIRRAVAAGARAFNEAGVTTIYEGHGIPAVPQRAYLDLWQAGELTVRTYFVISYPVSAYTDLESGRRLIEQTAVYAAGKGFGDDLLRFGGLGFSFDSAAAMGACLMREPYLGALGRPWRGVQLPKDDVFREILFRCAREGIRVQVQCSGGAAIDKVLAIYEEIDREIPVLGKRWTIQHCQFPSRGNIDTCCRLGVVPTTTTNFIWLYGSIYERSFGPEMANDAIPFKAWMDAGVPVAQCTDGRPHSPMFALWQMLARKDAHSGRTLATPGQKLTRQQALRAYTLNGAIAAFWDEVTGSIEPGKLADLVVLSDDIMTIDEDRIPETKVLATLLGGKPVHDTGIFS